MKFGYSMPSAAPLYPEPPYFYKSNQAISILFRTSAEILQELVPAPLLPNPDGQVFVYIGEFNVESPLKGNYREAGIVIPVSFKEGFGNYMLALYVDSVQAIAGGREIWGWPKKEAVITLTVEPGRFQASVSRLGSLLINASVNAIEPVHPIPVQPDAPAFNLKIVPSVMKIHAPDVLQLTSTTSTSVKKELSRGPASLAFAASPEDRLERIPILEIISAEHYIEDLCLDCGEVLFDYLAEIH